MIIKLMLISGVLYVLFFAILMGSIHCDIAKGFKYTIYFSPIIIYGQWIVYSTGGIFLFSLITYVIIQWMKVINLTN